MCVSGDVLVVRGREGEGLAVRGEGKRWHW